MEGAAYAMLSDGCSDGGYTDVGSRLLVHAGVKAIQEHWSAQGVTTGDTTHREIELQQNILVEGTCKVLGLSHNDLSATNLYGYLSSEGGFLRIVGDGVVAIVYNDGSITMHRYEWGYNTPFYPSYRQGLIREFVRRHGGDLSRTHACYEGTHDPNDDSKEAIFSKETRLWTPTSGFHDDNHQYYTLREGIAGETMYLDTDSMQDGIAFVGIFSDGVTQIDGLEWYDAVVRFMVFKGLKGAFAKRRMIRGIKDSHKTGRGPQDDISYAVIRIVAREGEDTEEVV